MSKFISKKEAFNKSLPKWPQCIISGPSVTKSQAMEIIRRTDDFFIYPSGNNHQFIKEATKIFNIPSHEDFKTENGSPDFAKYSDARQEFDDRWKCIRLEYLCNSWISCSWVGGPHGFCHPDGTIWFQNNIGKWPDVSEVYDDLKKLGEAFPFLEMTCTLMDAEEGEDANGVVSMHLKNGIIRFKEPVVKNNHKLPVTPWSINILNTSRENYFSLNELRNWAKNIAKEK